jgi:cytochrome bd-type quinol oxidase subunit 2
VNPRRRKHRRQHRRGLSLWLVPIAILGGIALIGFAVFYLFDHKVTGVGPPVGFTHFEPGLITDAMSGLAGMTAAVLGIVITVVSLLVQLTSERYTGVAQMFLRDRTNIFVMSYYVVTCVVGVFASLSLHAAFVPRATVITILAATALGIVIMLPYFMYVFRFLAPTNLVERIHHVELDRRQGQDHREPRRRRDPRLRRRVPRGEEPRAAEVVRDRRRDPHEPRLRRDGSRVAA